MRCAYCGKKLRETAKFCPYCGKKNDAGSEFAEKFNVENELLVVKAQEIFRGAKTPPSEKGGKFPVSAVVFAVCAVLVCAGIFAAVKFIVPEVRYTNAEKLYTDGNYSEAEKAFSALNGYKDSGRYVLKCGYENALELMNDGLYPEAADAFTSLDGYADSDALAAECMVEIADEYAENGNLPAAASVYAAAGKPELIVPSAKRKAASLAENGNYFDAAAISARYDSAEQAAEYRYMGASAAKESGDFKTAADNFYILGDYKDSAALYEECAYGFYHAEYNEKGASEETVRGFYFLGNYRDSRDLFLKASYEYGKSCLENGDCFMAEAMFKNAAGYKNSAEMLYKARYALGDSLLEDDPASARSVFAFLSTYSDSARKKSSAAERLSEKESWYADGFTAVDGVTGSDAAKPSGVYYTSVFKKSDGLVIFCNAGTDTISAPVTLTLTLRDSTGNEVSADCENVRNSGSFSGSFTLSGFSAGKAEIIISRKDSGNILRTIEITIE